MAQRLARRPDDDAETDAPGGPPGLGILTTAPEGAVPGSGSAPPGGSDAERVRAAQADPAAFAALYERYFPAVYRYCLRRLGNPALAEDAAARVFLSALANITRCRAPDRFRSWLFAIAHNELTSHYRGHEPPLPLRDETARAIPDAGATPEERVIAAESARSLHAALATLPEDQRRVIELRLAGLDGIEIAEVIGKRHGAIRSLQHRAIRRLREVLNER